MDNMNINGFDVFLFYNKNKTTYINSYILSGMFNETKQHTGINHLLEHILTNAWKKCLNHKCSTYWKSRGVSYNAYTHDSHLNYYTFGLKEFNDEMLEYIVSIVCKPIINDTMIYNETNAVKNELLSLINNPRYEIYDTFNKHFFIGEGLNYSNDYKEQLEILNSFDLNTLKDYFKRYYTPNNIMFSISGDFNKSKILDYFKKNLPNDTFQKMIIPKNIFTYSNKIIHIKESKLKNYILYLGFPTKFTYNHIHLDSVLSILETSLFEHLRTNLKLIYGINVEKHSNYLGTFVTIFVEVDSKNVKRLITELLNKIEYHKKNVFSKDMIDNYKLKYKLNYFNSIDNTVSISDFYMKQFINNSKIIYSKDDIYKINSNINSKQLLSKMNDIFKFEHMLFIYKSSKVI